MSQEEVDILKRALAREKASRKAAEAILEAKSAELFEVNQKLEISHKELSTLYDNTSSQLQGVFENIVDAYVVMDLNGNVLKFNDAATELFGYDVDKESVNVVSLIYKEDYDYAMTSFLELQTKGFFKNYEARVYTKAKEVKRVHINASLVLDKNGVPMAAQGIVRDITLEREQSLIIDMVNDVAKALLGKMDIYEIAWEITNNIAEYLDTKDCIIYLVDNEQNTLEQIAAYGTKLTSDKQIKDKIALPIGDGIVGSVAKTGKAEIIGDTSKDNRYIVDDEIRFSEISVPIISDGKVIGVIDSEHHSKNYFTKEHLRTLKNIASLVAMQLKSAINLREREKVELRNTALLDALGKSNNELQEYAHIVSHDLKSPLRSIDALVSWIKEDNKGKLDNVTIQNFELIETTLEKMEQLISDILLYSSIGSESKDENSVDLNALIEELMQILYVPENISINVLNNLPIVIGDKTKFQQLFQNLISNAIKFNNKAQGLIEVDVIEQKSYYQFSIKDNGMGIDKKYHDKIFKIFHALHDNKESTGIGLSIVKKIVDLYKGEIWLKSESNKGTTFFFTIKK
ncbi:ATP-binding protein [uncultured Winogradskyella sp.]|uniref:GAF domain-containing sensor histidine kinase n=1 Tax=uncultured Winogradskyella sp. TaxID=395353 RepID=UPI002632B133|nr:ATP-binding protein [uncultured Winogradskyella sp.]